MAVFYRGEIKLQKTVKVPLSQDHKTLAQTAGSPSDPHAIETTRT
jgi:hypothetical protein